MSKNKRAAFEVWNDMEITGMDADDGSDVSVRVAVGLVVDDRGLRIGVGGVRGTFAEHSIDERALYEALRVRFDAGHREAVQKAALAKLTALEQQVLREAFGPMEAAAARAEPSGEKAPKRNGKPEAC